jgi:molecular chaperone GrpE
MKEDPKAGGDGGEPGAAVGWEPRAGEEAPSAGTAPGTLPEASARIAELEAEVASRAAAARENEDRWLRERAELENFKRRMQRDKSEALRYANEPLLRDLLPVVDNLERAVRAAHETESGGAETRAAGASALRSLVQGVEMVLQQFADVLSRYGVERVAAARQSFDPAHHEALAQIESHEHPAGTVVEEHQPGYRLHDRLLRPAQVTVSKAPSGRGGQGSA